MSAAKAPPRWHGLLLIDKPGGWTSHDVVARVRRLAGQKRVGHTGTLDPLATGLMAVLLGAATRLEPWLSKMDKSYTGRVELGLSTDSHDISGRETARCSGPWPESAVVLAALKKREGHGGQIPPAYSAISVNGQRAYKAARAGRPLELAPRQVSAYSLEMIAYSPPVLDFRAEVSSGYYIRSLARDLGADLALGGTLTALRRESVGAWHVAQAVTLDELAGWNDEDWRTRLLPSAAALPHLPSLTLNASEAKAFCQGKLIDVSQRDDLLEMDPGLRRDDGFEDAEAEAGEKYSPAIVLDAARLVRAQRVEGKASTIAGEYFSPASADPQPPPQKNLDKAPIKVLNAEGLLLGIGAIIYSSLGAHNTPPEPFLRPLRVLSSG